MNFEQFKSNVEQWSTERGIYEHSTALAQALKAVSEVGELADAVIKNDRDALIDAIGDVAVCLVNVARMTDAELIEELIKCQYFYGEHLTPKQVVSCVSKAVGEVCYSVASLDGCECIDDALDASLVSIVHMASVSNLDFMECCTSAWNEIKDRKGHMVAGGAFVKEDV